MSGASRSCIRRAQRRCGWKRRCRGICLSFAEPISATLNSAYRLIVFDWDGTLMDSTVGITAAIQESARDLGLPVPDRERASHVIGLGLQDALQAAVPPRPQDKYAEFVEAYRRHFRVRQDDMELFPGVREMLEELRGRGRRLAVATGKSRRGLDHQFGLTGLGPLFAASRCADETRPK